MFAIIIEPLTMDSTNYVTTVKINGKNNTVTSRLSENK